jgi:hypothetical protein
VPYFNEPAMFISPQAIVDLPTGAHVERFFDLVMANLRSQDYAASEFSNVTERYLTQELAIVSGIGVWKTRTGQELRRFGFTYTLCRVLQSWKIVVATIHDPPTAPQ